MKQKFKSKISYNKAVKIIEQLNQLKSTLNFQGLDQEDRNYIYKAIDEMNKFIENIIIYEK